MERIHLPDNAWADVRDDISKAPRRLVRDVKAAAMALTSLPSFDRIKDAANADEATKLGIAASDLPSAVPLMEALTVAQILAVVVEWSFGEVSADVLADVPSDAFEALAAEVEKRSGSTKAETSLADFADPTPALEGSSA